MLLPCFSSPRDREDSILKEIYTLDVLGHFVKSLNSDVLLEASEGKSSCESMVVFPGVMNFTVGSINFRAMKMLRCA